MNNELKISGIVLSGIAAALILIPIFASDTTIFLTTENGGTPQSCAPENGLVLAQNLTDLCDVTIISPVSNQIIQYNGSQWVNVNQASFTNETTTCNNIGSGVILCAGDNVDIKTVTALSGIQITNDSNTVYFANTGVTGLVASIGISINASTGVVTITNTLPESTVCTNQGIGIQVFKDGNCNFRTLLGSPDISITQGTNEITIDYNGTLSSESTVCTNDGHGTGIVCNGGNVHLKGIASGSGITITQNGTDIIVTSNAINESTVCSGQSGNYNIVASSSSGNCTFKNLVAGTGISLSSNSTHITITNTSPEDTQCSSAGGTSIIKTSSGGDCDFKGLTAGVGLTLTSNTNDNNYKTNFANGTSISITGTTTQTFTNTAPESTVCTNLNPTGEGIYVSGNCNFKKLLAGSAISLSSNGTRITITNDKPCGDLSDNNGNGVSDDICITGEISAGTGMSLTVSGTKVNTNFVNGTGILITGSAAQTFKTNFANGTGVTITGSTTQTFSSSCANTGSGEAVCESSNNINSLIAGTGITIADTTGDLTITNSGAVKICNAVADGGETTLTCTFSPTTFKSFVMKSSFTSTQADTWVLRFNADSGNNYTIRSSTNGGADATSGATGNYATVTIVANQWYHYNFDCKEPLSTQEKHCYGFRVTSANGSANADARVEFASKWANTASVITDTELVRTAGTGTMTAGSFITVWGVSQ